IQQGQVRDVLHNTYARGPVTGRVSVVVANPNDPLGDVWVGAAGGGVWNGDLFPGGPYWFPMTDDAAALSVGAIALDSCSTQRCNTIWVGTGENAIRRDTQYGRGVLVGRFNAVTLKYV